MFDIAIVGSGAGGMPAAWHLVSKGYKVVCIEKGDSLEIDKHYTLEAGYEIMKETVLATKAANRNDNEIYNIDCSNSPIEIHNFSGIGGSTLMHSCMWPRMHRNDFNMHSTYGIGTDWPISLDDLLPYYELDTKITGVAGRSGNPYHPEYVPTMREITSCLQSKAWEEAFNKYGWETWPAYAALNTEEYDGREKDDYKWPSNMGPKGTSKGSTVNTYYPKALEKGLIVLKNTTITRIHTERNENGQKTVTGLAFINKNNERGIIRAKKFILSCGGIGTPALILVSNICKGSGMVGKNLMLHPWGYIEGKLKKNINSNKGPQGCCLMSQQKAMHNPHNPFESGYTVQIIRGPLPGELAKKIIKMRLKRKDKTFMETFKEYYNKTIHAVVICDDLPETSNMVSAEYNKEKIEIKINYYLSENSKRQLEDGINHVRKIMNIAGAYKTNCMGPVRETGWHTLGTCRMGEDPRTSVVDKYAKAHNIDNLYISDASIFSTGGSVNPGATIQALSLYIADNIHKQWLK